MNPFLPQRTQSSQRRRGEKTQNEQCKKVEVCIEDFALNVVHFAFCLFSVFSVPSVANPIAKLTETYLL